MAGHPGHFYSGLRSAGAAILLSALGLVAAAPAQACPGAAPSCPYTSASQIGQRGGGVLRFPQTVAIGPDGAIYVGDQSSHIVQVFSPDGRFAREVGIAGSRPGELNHVGAVAVAPDNTLIVADGSNRIDRFDPSGRLIGSFGSEGRGIGQFRFGRGSGNTAGAGGGLAVQGNTLFVSDSANNRVQRFNLDGSAGKQIAPGFLDYPRGLVVRGKRLVVADDQNHRLAVFSTNGRFIRTVGRGPGRAPRQFNFPYGVAFDRAGRLFVADDLNQRVVRLGPAPRYSYKARWGSYGTGPGQLAFPRAIATDAFNLVYVTNTGNDRIDVFTRSGRLVRSFGASGRATGQFNGPTGVAADGAGFRAVADTINGRVQFLNPDGSIATVWGSPNPGPTIILRPVAVAFDPTGNAYVLDQKRSRIFVFERATGLPARTIGSRGRGAGRLLDPSALAIDDAGTIHVADTNNRRISRFSTSGAYRGATATGSGRLRGIAVTPDGARTYVSNARHQIVSYDAAGTEIARFAGSGTSIGKLRNPRQISLDAAGNVWVADHDNDRIQQFGPNGEKLLTFGERGTGLGQFVRPVSVNVSCLGTLTVGDRDNNRVQQFKLAAPVAPPCRSLGALGTPPRPQTPTLPEPPGPLVHVTTVRTRGLFTSRKLKLRLGCDTSCTVTVTGTLAQRNKPRGGRKRVTVGMRRLRVKLPAASRRTVGLAVSRSSARRLRRALRGGRGLTATLRIVARPPTGEPTYVTKRVRARG